MATVAQLKQLAQHLSPTFKIAAQDVPDVLSALVALGEHGDDLQTAVQDGAQGVADFYHDVAVADAEAAGTEPPRKGAPVTTAPASPQAGVAVTTGGVSADDVAQIVRRELTAALAALQAGQVSVAPVSPATESQPEAPASEAPAPPPAAATGAE